MILHLLTYITCNTNLNKLRLYVNSSIKRPFRRFIKKQVCVDCYVQFETNLRK